MTIMWSIKWLSQKLCLLFSQEVIFLHIVNWLLTSHHTKARWETVLDNQYKSISLLRRNTNTVMSNYKWNSYVTCHMIACNKHDSMPERWAVQITREETSYHNARNWFSVRHLCEAKLIGRKPRDRCLELFQQKDNKTNITIHFAFY